VLRKAGLRYNSAGFPCPAKFAILRAKPRPQIGFLCYHEGIDQDALPPLCLLKNPTKTHDIACLQPFSVSNFAACLVSVATCIRNKRIVRIASACVLWHAGPRCLNRLSCPRMSLHNKTCKHEEDHHTQIAEVFHD
jgi:hypothetical protein